MHNSISAVHLYAARNTDKTQYTKIEQYTKQTSKLYLHLLASQQLEQCLKYEKTLVSCQGHLLSYS